MRSHDELDQLSAYLDGELDSAERARIDAHLPGCAECRATMDALRSTLADLRALPEEAPSDQDSWALRSAIEQARKPARRWQRYVMTAGAAAAALVAVVAVARHSGQSFQATSLQANSAVPVVTLAQNFDQFSAQAHLLEVIGRVPVGSVTSAPQALSKGSYAEGGGAVGGPDQKTASTAFPLSVPAPVAVPTGDIARCVDIVRRSQQDLLDPIRYEIASFDNTPAFFLIFRASDRYELWVVSRIPQHACDVLFFSQTH